MIFAQAIPDIPDPSGVLDRATQFGWAEGLIAFFMISLLLIVAGAIMYLLPTARDNMKKSGVLLDVASQCLPEIKAMNGTTVDRLQSLKEQLHDHNSIAMSASEILKHSGGYQEKHRQIVLTACSGVKEYLRDANAAVNKQQYIHYVEEIEAVIRSMS